MTNPQEKMPVKLFGINRKQVDEYLQKLEVEYLANIQELMRNINGVEGEKEILVNELEALQDKLDTHAFSAEVLEEAMKRLEASLTLITGTASVEAEEILQQSKKSEDVYGNKIAGTRSDIIKTKGQMEELLHGLMDVLEKNSEPAPEVKLPNPLPQPRTMGKIIPYAIKGANLPIEVKEEVKEETLQKVEFVGVVNEPKDIKSDLQDETVKKTRSFWDEEKEEASELLAASLCTGVLDERVNTADAVEKHSPAEQSAGFTGSLNKEVDMSGNFWGEPVFEKKNEIKKILPIEEPTEKPEQQEAEYNNRAESSGALDKEAVQQHEIPSGQGSQVKSSAMEEEINWIRNKYIVGKIAGDQLLGHDGRMIIAKNEVITIDIVKRAEREGKLSELIINMVIPGLEN